VAGQNEKWQILRAHTALSLSLSTHSGSATTAAAVSAAAVASSSSHFLGSEDVTARGSFVRAGDSLLLQTFKSDHLLSVSDGERERLPKLVYRERSGLGAETFQIEVFGAVSLPQWCSNRPFLR
jgi:hypothetical protein